MNRKTLFIVVFAAGLFFSFSAKADVEFIQGSLTAFLDVVEGYKEKILKIQSYKLKVEERVKQAKKYANDAKKTFEKGKKVVLNAKQKAENIKNKVHNTLEAVKSGDLKAALGSMELAGLKDTFNGTKMDDEMAEAVLDVMVRKKGSDSIANQKALTHALNKKIGKDMAEKYANSLILRQELKEEEDSFEAPESIDEAVELYQEAALSVQKRQQKILEMKAAEIAYEHSAGIRNLEGDEENDEK